MKNEVTTILVRIDKDLKQQCQVKASEKDITISQLVRKAIRKFVEDGN